MKNNYIIIILFFSSIAAAQNIPNLPIPIGAGSAEVWNDSIYFIGGASLWWGTTLYPRIYKYDGLEWSYFDSIPDNSVWDVQSVLVEDEIYLLSGWPSGAGKLRKYDLVSDTWSYLNSSPNLSDYGNAAEYYDGFVYLFNPASQVYAYEIATSQWQIKTSCPESGYLGLISNLYNGEIYITGYADSTFFKYNPATDQWTKLANTPYQVIAGSMEHVDERIYCIGGNGPGSGLYSSVIAYNPSSDEWTLENFQLDSKRHWMASVKYLEHLYVLGGFDSINGGVDLVEEIILKAPTEVEFSEYKPAPTEILLHQNYPNPFNPSTVIGYQLPVSGNVTLKIYDVLGNEVTTLVDEYKPAGRYEVEFSAKGGSASGGDAFNLSSGVYLYKLRSGNFSQTKKLILMK